MLNMCRRLRSSRGISAKPFAAEIDYEAEKIADSGSPLVQPTHRDSRSLLPACLPTWVSTMKRQGHRVSSFSSMNFAWHFQAHSDLVSAEARLQFHRFDEGQCIGTRWHIRTEASDVVDVISILDGDLRTLVAMGKDVLDGIHAHP